MEQKVNSNIFKNEETMKKQYSKIQRQISNLLDSIDDMREGGFSPG